jgi:hypothetical protein
VSTYARLGELPLEIDSYALEGLELTPREGFTRRTTVIRLRGAGEEGVGEDVTYDAESQLEQQTRGAVLELAGRHTLGSFSRLLDGAELGAPGHEADHRRWGYESAALDLALRQCGCALADVLEREPEPVTYVVSAATRKVPRLLELYPDVRFKLDADSGWTDELVAGLAATGRVDTVDYKGVFRGDFGNPPDAELYRRVAEAFPGAWLEDPGLTPETDEALRPHRDRVTWDAPIHSVADVEALPFAPRCVNVKPSRFGTVRRLFDFYDWSADHGIELYGGGQFELGPGRGQIQLLAALFHPDGPNDVAPGGFNEPEPRAGLPQSPLDPCPAAVGFRRETRRL